MDINELKSKVLEQAQESAQLAQNKRALEKQIKDTIAKNFNEIVKPFMTDMNKLIKSVSDLSNTSVSFSAEENTVKLFLGENVPDCYFFRLNKYWGGIYTNFGRTSDHHYNRWDTDLLTQTDCWSNDNILNLSYWFLSEEKSQEFVEIVKKYYVELLEKYSVLVKVRNEQLSQSITELTEELKRASTVEHKEDGTVEIHLGGKTYRATLKEGEGC